MRDCSFVSSSVGSPRTFWVMKVRLSSNLLRLHCCLLSVLYLLCLLLRVLVVEGFVGVASLRVEM